MLHFVNPLLFNAEFRSSTSKLGCSFQQKSTIHKTYFCYQHSVWNSFSKFCNVARSTDIFNFKLNESINVGLKAGRIFSGAHLWFFLPSGRHWCFHSFPEISGKTSFFSMVHNSILCYYSTEESLYSAIPARQLQLKKFAVALNKCERKELNLCLLREWVTVLHQPRGYWQLCKSVLKESKSSILLYLINLMC